MKFLSLLILLASVSAQAMPAHFDLDMSTHEYETYLDAHPAAMVQVADEPSIASALLIGKRLSDWLATENARRAPNQQLRLTSLATRAGVPIDAPSIYNPASIQVKMDAALAALPAAMKEVLTSTTAFPATIPTDDVNFTTLGRAVDKVYQSAARWKSLKPYIGSYTKLKTQDVRGYYFLKKNAWTAARLALLANETQAVQAQVKEWLKQECLNASASDRTVTDASCTQELDTAASANTLGAYFTKYNPVAQKMWDHYFVIPNGVARTDIVWNAQNPYIMNVPFNNPGIARIQSYLGDNIQDEWKFNNWQLKLNFGTYPQGPAVQFQTGVVPHVNGVGGNLIIMDQNMSIDEYESQWTIRHEFGHVLGFLDCYLEFYDTSLQAFVNYQLDTTDLMCSRAGNMKERLYTELKRVYYKP